MWAILASWPALAVVVPVVIAIGLALVSVTPPSYGPAQVSFALAAVLLLARVAWWLGFERSGDTAIQRTAFAFLVFGTIGVLWSESFRWVNARRMRPAAAQAVSAEFRAKAPDTFHFSLGGGGITFTVTRENLEKSTLLNAGGLVPVKLHLDENGVLYCDVTIWGGLGGRPAIQVVRNELTVTPAQWDKNFNATALEVVNEHGMPIFQLIRKDPSHYVMNGFMPLPDGRLIVATDAGTAFVQGSTIVLTPPWQLHPIFRYPSWKYPGQFTGSP